MFPPIVKFACAILLLTTPLTSCGLRSQEVPERLRTGYEPLDNKLAKLVTADEWAISPEEARTLGKEVLFVDARAKKEFAVSHLPGAVHADYPAVPSLPRTRPKDAPIVVYCTVGYRSERTASKLRKEGYTRVYNLYGSLYAWKLAGFDTVDKKGQPTDAVHTYNREWGTYFPDSLGRKVH